MKKLILIVLLGGLFLNCKSYSNKDVKKNLDDDTYDIRNNTICCDRSYGIKIKGGEEKIYFLGIAGVLVEEADLKTFKAYDNFKEIDGIIYDAEDKNNYYEIGNIVKKK